jgi:hypothetical protein
LRGDGIGELQEWDRVYNYAYYNDLGNPKKGLVSILTLIGEEHDDPQRRQVRHFNSTNNTFTRSSAKSAEPLDTMICSSIPYSFSHYYNLYFYVFSFRKQKSNNLLN